MQKETVTLSTYSAGLVVPTLQATSSKANPGMSAVLYPAGSPIGRKGSQNHKTKLTNEQVLAIYASNAPRREIAAEYGIHVNTVKQIHSGETWAWLTGAHGGAE